MSLRDRVQRLEAVGPSMPTPPGTRETPEQTRVREEYEQSLALLHERTGGRDDLALRVAQDPQARTLAKAAREKMRAFLAVTSPER
jgi:hypothetical protein